MTKAATNTPTTSTLNFPLGDVRANGVTGPLSSTGTVGLVYKAGSGTTQLILDIAGYFRASGVTGAVLPTAPGVSPIEPSRPASERGAEWPVRLDAHRRAR